MTHSTQNSKSILAKALAEENLQVQFDPSAQTAMCDVANRVITLPVWEGLSDAARDLMIGHEIGHALFTPDIDAGKQTQGPWTSAAEEIGGNVHASYVQGIMQIVEDVRIERKVKEKYPGLRRDFSAGYRELFDKNFFGTDGIDLSKSSFADRINLHFKVGVHLAVPFSAEEQEIVNRIEKSNTFDDTIALTAEVFRYIGGKRQDVKQPKNQQSQVAAPQMNPKNGKDDSQGQDANNSGGEKQEKGNATSSNNGNQNSDKSQSGSDCKSEKGENPAESMGSAPMGAGTGLAPELPAMRTQSNFDANQKKSVSQKVSSVYYSSIPVPNTNRIILPYKKCQDQLTQHFTNFPRIASQNDKVMTRIREKYTRLVTNTRPIIGNLVQQFDMKKAADEQKRTSTARSGKLDTDRLCLHKITDDIFLNYTTIADGKNHGMVMFIDWSSSMQASTEDVLTQVVMLSQFCKRMQIPFDVYLFSSQYTTLANHIGINPNSAEAAHYNQWSENAKVKNIRKVHGKSMTENNDDSFHHSRSECFVLLHVLSSEMKNNEFNEAMFNVFALGQMVTSPRDITENLSYYRVCAPLGFNQGNTPLDSTIIAAMKIVPEFQQKHKVQIVNTIFLTDGETGYSSIAIAHNPMFAKAFVSCPMNNKEYDISHYTRTTDALLHVFGDVTGSNTIGFYIPAKGGYCPYFQGDRKDEFVKLKENGFIEAPRFRYNETYDYAQHKMVIDTASKPTINHGYDRLFVLPNNHDVADLESVDEMLNDLPTNATFTRVRNTFFKAVEKRGNSRAFINRFSDVIANHVKR
jgi:hypothetical protein